MQVQSPHKGGPADEIHRRNVSRGDVGRRVTNNSLSLNLSILKFGLVGYTPYVSRSS
jgi:hypothetical protein